MGPRSHLGPGQGLFRQMRQRRVGREIQRLQRLWVRGECVSVAESDIDLVERIRRQRIAIVKMRRYRRREPRDQPMYLLPCRFVACDGKGARKAGHILSETMSGNESMHVE